jgi:hypothetical protein
VAGAVTGRSTVVLRLLLAHGLAYPVAIAWAFGSIPLIVVRVASAVGLTLSDEEIAHRVLLLVAWPSIASFVLVHAAGVVWALGKESPRARRVFVVATAALFVVPVVVGGGSWVWLVTRP